ncbi:MAG: hypothetical protein JSW11_00105 [Candidatus Heimdallarchaeota archaeon]|nr:MAG: hypothetical protein JSW11_00105 [Candidatus Heimdallarchaeota archaeon]
MYFPFSLKSASNWLDFVPELLSTLRLDSSYVDNKEFHNYLASTLETFFPEASDQFLLTIFTLLMEATDAGKYVVLQTLLYAEGVWEALAHDETFQPLLTGLALSTNKIYSKSAATFSRKLEELQFPEAEETEPELMYEKEEEALEEAALDNILEGALEEISSERMRSAAPTKKFTPTRPTPTPAAPPPEPTAAPAGPPAAPPSPPGSPRISPPAPKAAPPPSTAAGAPPPRPAPTPAPVAAKADDALAMRGGVSEKLKKAAREEVKFEKMAGTPLEPPSADTMHTHVHYYSKMLSRKTYPLVVTLSRIVREIAKDKSHFLSGEEEKETRGEFELTDVTKRLVVEPLLSGCLIQPSSQFIDPRPQNLPKVLTFFVTPLVDAGFRFTPLTGSISVKNETGTVLLKLSLPELSVTSHRVSKTAALVGTVGGGAMPALDLLFGVNLQVTLASQLSSINPQLETFNMLWVVMGAQVLLFTIALGIAFLWWWKKGRAKVAPDRASTLQLA